MADMGRRKPATDEPFHSLPLDATMLASSAQRRCQRLLTVKRKWASAYRLPGTPKYRICPPTTDFNHSPTSGTGSCIRRRSRFSPLAVSPAYACEPFAEAP